MLCIIRDALVKAIVKVPTCLYSSITLNRFGSDLLGSLVDAISVSRTQEIEGGFTKEKDLSRKWIPRKLLQR